MEYIPRKRLAEHLVHGWTLVPNHEYNVDDYAILMLPPDLCYIELSRSAIASIVSRFTYVKTKPIRMSNLKRAAMSRDFVV